MPQLIFMRKDDQYAMPRVITQPAITPFKEAVKQQHISEPATMCMFCEKVAVVELPPVLLAEQTDGTTHICHPVLGGCNHGFEATK